MTKAILLSVPLLLSLSCATDQLEINPDLSPGESVGVKVKSCFDQKALDNRWGLGIPSLWNTLNGCEPPKEIILDAPVVLGDDSVLVSSGRLSKADRV